MTTMNDTSASTSVDDNNKMDVENELTKRFLNGQMSFAEYSSEWYSFEGDLDDENKRCEEEVPSPVGLTGKTVVRRRRMKRFTPALLGLMGEANLRFVRGDLETAEKMCHEIIKQVPTASEPYQTLAQIYENNPEKSLQFSLLAAHLGPSDANEWLRLAAISKERNDYRQEMICYTQAIRAEPDNLNLHLMRIDLLKQLEKLKYQMVSLNITHVKCYHRIVTSMPPNEGETVMKYAKLAAAMYHKTEEIERAVEVMATAYKKCSNMFTLEDINMFLELLMLAKEYQTCLDIFVAKAGVEIEAEIQTVKTVDGKIEEHTNYLRCTMSNDLPVDLKSKLLICFVYLGAHNLVNSLLDDFLMSDVEKAGDLYMDIEEALSSVGQHELALQLLDPLVKNNSFDLGAVWLKHGECLYNLGKENEAIQSYYRVLKHAPQNPEARRRLFSILESKGEIDDALNILQQDYKYVVSASLLHEHCLMLKKYNRMLKYLEVGQALLSKTFGKYRHKDELRMASRLKGGLEQIQHFRTIRGESLYDENELHFDDEENFKYSASDKWNLFTECLNIAYENKMYSTMQRLSFGALLSKGLSSRRQEIDFYCFQSSLLAKDFDVAFKYIRDFACKFVSPRSYNLLSLIVNSMEDNICVKFILRFFQRTTKNQELKLLFMGNNYLMSGRYLPALKYFLDYYEKTKETFAVLLIGISILVMAAQRTVNKHHNLILQGMSYMFKYKNVRQCDQEAYYNLGRAYQMLSINNLAIEYYEKALACGPVTECLQHGVIDLTKETAFNLYILYKDHSPHMARKYMLEYIVI